MNRLDCLAYANDVRLARADLKRRITAGEADPAESVMIVDDGMPAVDLVGAIKRVGPCRAVDALDRIGLDERHRLGGKRKLDRLPMTVRQRTELAREISTRLVPKAVR